jgi:hypothetical protein
MAMASQICAVSRSRTGRTARAKVVTMTNDKTKELPTGFIITVYRAGRSLVRLVKAAVVQWRASPSETRTGSLPS